MPELRKNADSAMQDAMDEVTRQLTEAIPEKLKIVFEKYSAHAKTEILKYALRKGDIMPDFLLPDTNGKLISSIELRAKGPLVVTFVRGDWCPYCHTTLNILQEECMVFKARGATLVAISPQSIDASAKMSKNGKLKFPLLSDDRCEYAESCDLAFALDDDFFQELNSVVPDYNGNNDWLLPVPATFVIDTDGTILYSFLETEIWKRAEPAQIAMAIPQRRLNALETMADRIQNKVEDIELTLSLDDIKAVKKETEKLRASGLESKAIQVAHPYVPFDLQDTKGQRVKSRKLLQFGPLLVSFYQGGWSDFDKIELKALKKSHNNFQSRGINIVAISTAPPSTSASLAKELRLPFPLLWDKGGQVASKYRLVYEPTSILEADRRPTEYTSLVIPATYIIGQNKRVDYAHINVDPTIRADPKRVARVTPAVKTSGLFGRKPLSPGTFSIKVMDWMPFVHKRNSGGFTSRSVDLAYERDNDDSSLSSGTTNQSVKSDSIITANFAKSSHMKRSNLAQRAAFAA